eukprot:671622-Pelagomonas_calceolata.AAC.10
MSILPARHYDRCHFQPSQLLLGRAFKCMVDQMPLSASGTPCFVLTNSHIHYWLQITILLLTYCKDGYARCCAEWLT